MNSNKWNKFIFESQNNSKVICHITGYSGSGKSTLLDLIKNKFPNVSALDLDDLDEKADQFLKYEDGWKSNSYSDEKLFKSHKIRQTLLDKFIKNHKNIVLVGHHVEGETVYNFDSIQNFILKVPRETVKKQKIARDNQSEEEFEKQYSDENKIFGDLSGYNEASPQEILHFIKSNIK